MKKISLFLFLIVVLVIAGFGVKKYFFNKEETQIEPPKIVAPRGTQNEQALHTTEQEIIESVELTSLITLMPGETLLNTYSEDFNLDGFTDQIIAIKPNNNPFIKIIVGLYNQKTGNYERSYEIVTEIEQVKTFSFTIMDIIGNHQNTLIITGFSTSKVSVLQAWLPINIGNKFSMKLIADLQAEGTIFIEQQVRGDSYALHNANGASFPIWTYTIDPTADENSLDQLHIMWDWDSKTQMYIEKTRKKIPGKKITAQELAKIQDGTEQTFAHFLDGLWLSPTRDKKNMQYLFFNYDQKEIIFLENDTEEIYSWGRSRLRRNGILIYAQNKSLSNYSRRFDIALVSTNEIRIKITDDLGMIIGSDTDWDGNYKKQDKMTYVPPTQTIQQGKDTTVQSIISQKGNTFWKSSTGLELEFINTQFYVRQKQEQAQGVFAIDYVKNEPILQFKTLGGTSIIEEFYKATYDSQEKKLLLQPVTITLQEVELKTGELLSFVLAEK